jgi:chemotaxis protein MotB
VSYADFMTLMFAFFTVMYAVSTVDAGKVAPAAASIHDAFSMPAPAVGAGLLESAPSAPRILAVPPGNLEDVRRRLSSELSDAVASGRLEIAKDGRGLVLSLPSEATFPTGSAEVHADARLLIARIAATLRSLDHAIRIEGHTDDVPIRTARYGSNWELSTARASAVVAFLIDEAHLHPARLSAAGYAEFHPRVSNVSAESRARNRRVDIVVLNPAATREEPADIGARP